MSLDSTAAPARAEPVLRQVAVPGRRLAVRRTEPSEGVQAGPPLLLLHGVPQDSRCWSPLLRELGRDRMVLAPDLPGLGGSEIRGPYDVRSVAASLVALLAAELDGVGADPDAVGEAGGEESTPTRVDVIGHDWGGSLALAVAAARPDLVRRIGIVSAPYRKVDVTRAWHIPLLGFVPPGLFAGTGRRMVRAMFSYAWRTGRPPAGLVEQYAAAYAAPERVRAMAGYYRAAVRRRRSSDGTDEPSVRAERSLVVWGTDDPPMPLRVGESVVADLGTVNDPATVRMVTLPGVGHWPLDEVPDVVVPLLTSFVRD